MNNKPYESFGDEWKAEMMKWNKSELIDFIAKEMQYKQLLTQAEAEKQVRGILNDFETCIYSKEQAFQALGKLVFSLMHTFTTNAKNLTADIEEDDDSLDLIDVTNEKHGIE